MQASIDNIIAIETAGTQSALTQCADKVIFPLSADDKALLHTMEALLLKLGGVGLAAPQLDQAKRIIAIYIPEDASAIREDTRTYDLHFLFNASYQGIDEEGTEADFEGCYSVQSRAGKVKRYQRIHVTFQDENGAWQQKQADGFYARVLQHEIDHTEGLLITDRLSPSCIQGSVQAMRELRRQSLSPAKRAVYDELLHKAMAKAQPDSKA